MSSNQTLLQKADLALSDLTTAGLLSNEQAKTFVRTLIDQPTILNRARSVSMGAPTREINKIGFGSRILHAATAGTASTSGQRAKPDLSKVELNAKEVMATVFLPYDVLEDNIESAEAAGNGASNAGAGGLHATLLALIAERAAIDLEEQGLKGDVDSGDAYLAMQDGWLEVVKDDGNQYDHGSSPISKTAFKQAKKALPTQYLRNAGSMVHYVSHDQETEYRDTLADRATALGDRMVEGMAPAMAYGSPVLPCANMPEANALFGNPLNYIFGIWRKISMEHDKDIHKRQYEIVLTARIAFEVEEADAAVRTNNIATA